jgi:curved DNA-binding protein CbpA
MKGSNKPPEMYKIEDEVAGIIEDIDFYSYYQLLELRENATAELVDFHFHAKRDQFDKLKRDIYCGPKLFQNIEILMDRIEEAHQVLSNPRLRMEYDQGLVLGRTRHYQVAQQRALASAPVEVEQDEYLEQVTSGLQKKLGDEFLHAGEDEEVEGRQSIDEEYLDEAVEHLSRKLQQHNIDLHNEEEEAIPPEDQSADASFAHELVDDLEDELQSEFGLESLGIRSDEELQEERERKRLAEELKDSGPQIALQDGVTPLISSLYKSDEEEKQDFMPQRLTPRLDIQPAPTNTAASGADQTIDLEDEEKDGAPAATAAPGPRERREEDHAPVLYDDVIQLDDDD